MKPTSNLAGDSLERQVVDWGVSRPHEEETGELACVWLKFARPLSPQGISKKQIIRAVQWYRGDIRTPIGSSILVFDELRRGLWAKVRYVALREIESFFKRSHKVIAKKLA